MDNHAPRNADLSVTSRPYEGAQLGILYSPVSP
jgi:hypothetical protein